MKMLRLDYTHLAALLAVKRTGSFEGASQVMGISAIGVSRRISKFEASMGTKLLIRKPTRPTEAGEALCRYAEKVEELEDRLMDERLANGLQDASCTGTLNIAVCDQVLSDWFHRVVSDDCGSSNRRLDITPCEPCEALDLMRSGEVVAGLTHTKDPIHGFKSHSLGAIRFLAIASPDFVDRHFKDGMTTDALCMAPALRASNRDRLILEWIEAFTGCPVSLMPQSLPCPAAILQACMGGTAWAVLLASTVEPHLAEGTLVDIAPNHPFTRDFYWHVASALAPHVMELTAAIRKAAKSSPR